MSGGGSGYSIPVLSSKQFGTLYAPTLSSSATQYWLDAGQSWSATNPLLGSSSSERWQTSQTSSGTVTASQTTTFAYYHQYSYTLSYAVSGGGSGYSAPNLSSTQFGAGYTPSLTSSASPYWIDAGSTWSVENPLPGSSSNERWISIQTTSGSASSAQTIAFTYYNQYCFTLNYSIAGGGSGYSAPSLSAKQYGSTYAPTLTSSATAYWVDAGSSWSVTNPLSGSAGSERWDTSSTVSGSVSTAQTTSFTYYHQFQMTLEYTINNSPPGA